MLPSSVSSRQRTKAAFDAPPQSHKVMLFKLCRGKSYHVVHHYLCLFTLSIAIPGEDALKEPPRMPPPNKDINHVKWPSDPAHPWRNTQFPDLRYVPLPRDDGPKRPRTKQQSIKCGKILAASSSSQQHGGR